MNMSIKKRILTAAAAVSLGVGGAVAIQTPAHASFDWCHGVSVVCLAEHNDGNGYRWGPRSFPYGVCVGVPTALNDKISSLWNKYGWDDSSPPLQFTIYKNNPCNTGIALYTYGPEAYVQYVGNANNDQTSAVCLGPRIPGRCP